jgi:hypothetical protein
MKWFDFHKQILRDSYGSGDLVGLLHVRQDNKMSMNSTGI